LFNPTDQFRNGAPVLIVAVVGVAASVAVWALTVNSENRTFALEYTQRADNQASVLQSGISNYLEKLYAVRALFDSSNHPIMRDKFESFANSLLVDRPAILNISWLPRVTREGRDAHELAAARDGLPNYHIRTIGPHGTLPVSPQADEYFPKFYSTETRISPAYGLDNKDGDAREAALAHIRDAGVLSISPPLLLHIGNGDRRGFWAALPVYARGLPHETVDERRRNLLGYVQGVFQIGAMIETVFSGVTSPARLYLFAPDAALNDLPIFYMSHLGTGTIEAKSQEALTTELHRTFPLNFGDVRWTMVVTPGLANPLPGKHERSSIILICGLLFSAILTAFVWMVRRDARKLHQTNDELRRQKILLNTAIENISQGLCMFDANGRIMLFNEQYAKWMDLPAESLSGMSLLDVIKSRKASGKLIGDPQALFKSVVDSARQGKSSTRIIETLGNRALQVIERPMQGGGWVATSEDITESRKTQEQISYMAHHDALTGLWNRTTLIERLENALAVLPFSGGKIAIHFVDIDHLKRANDTLGHDGGDFLLKTVAERLKSVTRVGDAAARIGGDEFIVVQTEVKDVDQAEEFAKRLSSALSMPMILKNQTIIATASVGVALAPKDGTNPERLLKSADLALYKAKADGRNCIRFFQAEMNTDFEARFRLETIVRKAALHNQFELHYQPIVDIAGHRLVGFEALIRMRSDDETLIPPLVFIPIAEDLQLINDITAWVLRDACRAAATWPEHLTVAVNISPAQFWLGSISEDVAAALKEAGLTADRLELEITETQLLANTEAILAELLTVKAMGVAIVMDDFGTGYSSLSYLWRFPFDKIKIDRCFMQDFADSNRDVRTVVKTIIALGRELNMRVTIEGVETAAQAAFLEEVDGDQAQGYFFGRPVPASELSAIILAEFRKTHLVSPTTETAAMRGSGSNLV